LNIISYICKKLNTMKLVAVHHLNSLYILPTIYITYFDEKFSLEVMWFNRGLSLMSKESEEL
jgi:hypothetical protein